MSRMNRSVLLAGATGLIGRHCLSRLLADEDFARVVVLTRRPLNQQHARLVERVIDFERLADYAELFDVDAVLCCLGTTLSKAGSKAAFEKVDYGYVAALATVAINQGVKSFLLISAVGASPYSLAFYSRVKGRAEAVVQALSFPTVHILRPSLLLGDRDESRLAEDLVKPVAPFIAPFLWGPLARYRPVAADQVAALMVELARRDKRGVHIHYPSAR